MEAPDGRGAGRTPDRLGDFSPGLFVRRSPAAWVSSSQKTLPRTAAKASLKTTGERFPLVHP